MAASDAHRQHVIHPRSDPQDFACDHGDQPRQRIERRRNRAREQHRAEHRRRVLHHRILRRRGDELVPRPDRTERKQHRDRDQAATKNANTTRIVRKMMRDIMRAPVCRTRLRAGRLYNTARARVGWSCMAEIEFWYEFGSTYSYPAAMRIERLAARRRHCASLAALPARADLQGSRLERLSLQHLRRQGPLYVARP